MNIIILAALSFCLLTTQSFATTTCFLAKEGTQILVQKGDCLTRHPPCSTFKIAISLMGFDSGILIDETHPNWEYREEYQKLLPCLLDPWKTPHNPTLWLKSSSLWFSQIVTQTLGLERFQAYISNFAYGNQDIAGDKGLDNALTHSWLSSSLKISPAEQVAFLQKLIDGKLPVSQRAQRLTKNILFMEDFAEGWQLYGKTGTGNLLNTDGSKNEDRPLGWFVGWIQKADRRIVFAYYIEEDHKLVRSAGKYAKELTMEKLFELISNPQSDEQT